MATTERVLNADGRNYYTVNRIVGDAMDIVRDFVPDELNWLFLSTSGVHGSYCTLDDIERWLFGGDSKAVRQELGLGAGEPVPLEHEITVVILKPRVVCTLYGNAVVRTPEDIALLRSKVEQTAAGIAESQKGNRQDGKGSV